MNKKDILKKFSINSLNEVTIQNYINEIIIWDGIKINIKKNYDAIINLCGKNITDKRWSEKNKSDLVSSRINPTKAIGHIRNMLIRSAT